MSDKELAEELRKPIIKKFDKRKVRLSFIDNIYGADVADMQVISNIDKITRLLLCVIDVLSKYAWFISLKHKKGITITNAFQKNLKESNRKPNKIWVDKDSEFYNTSMKLWLEKNNIEMYSTQNEGKFVVAKRFIRALKNNIYKFQY